MTTSAVPILAMLPLLLFGGAAVLRPAPAIVPTLVATEGVTARRMDEATFRRRWPADMPPATVIHEVPTNGTALNRPSNYRTGDRALRPGDAIAAPAVAAATPTPRPARIVRRASLRLDVCAKHGMRRVEYLKRGHKHWRCRR